MSNCARVGPTRASSLPFIIPGKHLQSISGLINSLQRPLNYSSGYREQLELQQLAAHSGSEASQSRRWTPLGLQPQCPQGAPSLTEARPRVPGAQRGGAVQGAPSSSSDGNISPGPARDSASRPHLRALHPSCESMHQLPGPQAPRREPQGISRLEEFSRRALLTGCRNGERMLNFREESCPEPHTPVPEASGTLAGARPTRIPAMETWAKSPIACSFHPTHHKRKPP
ncbi:uncharacterized protein LOC120095219 [Rattus norvegicus]|uniref:uncharacterized protein LOC120095219 n=1 Tax=Rattus norvegicus TaxID=10116 RepID=UPI0003D101C0|nr:uncharacterized protein LOC120095219 [Rattus norvegicus]